LTQTLFFQWLASQVPGEAGARGGHHTQARNGQQNEREPLAGAQGTE